MGKSKILGTGLGGLVGSRIVELLIDYYAFENISRKTGIDITHKDSLIKKVKSVLDAKIILHMAAKADVDECEKDKPLAENGEAWKINVLGTKNVVEAARETGKKLIYISTDFVFDGKKQSGAYREEDGRRAINWYGQTKLEGEKIVESAGIPFIILRIAYPYRAIFAKKKDFIRAIAARLGEKKPISVVSDQVITPTFIDDVAGALDRVIQTNAVGIYHAVGSQFVTPHQAAVAIAKTFRYDRSLISKTTRREYFKNKAARGFRLALSNDKIRKLGVNMRTFAEGLGEVKRQQSV